MRRVVETYGPYLGAYWGERSEDSRSIARRVVTTLQEVEEAGPLFRDWHVLIGENLLPLPRDIAALSEVIESTVNLGDISHLAIPDLGYTLSAVSGNPDRPEGAALRVRAGRAKSVPQNSTVLTPACSGYGEGDFLPVAFAILQTLIRAWEPDWALFGTRELRSGQNLKGQLAHLGGLTWFSRRWIARIEDHLPTQCVSELDGGMLVDLRQGNPDDLPNPTTVWDLANELHAAGILASTA